MAVEEKNRPVRSTRTPEEFSQISLEFLRALRGSQSQNAMSRRLKYSSNVWHHWEAGRRAPALTDVMRAAALQERSDSGKQLAQRLQTPEGRQHMIVEMTIGQSL